MRILVFDNYDSFTYNLVQIIEQIVGSEVDVFRNDQIALEDIEKYDKIILSPGPGIPEEAGILLELIKKYAPTKSIFGVCLGQQAIAQAFGGSLINLSEQEKLVLDYLKSEGKITSRELESKLSVKDRRSRELLNDMVSKNIIEKKGKSKNTFYILKS